MENQDKQAELSGRTVLVVSLGSLSGATLAALLANKLVDETVLVLEGDVADSYGNIPHDLRIDAAALEKHVLVTMSDGMTSASARPKRTKQWLSPWATIGKQRGKRQQHLNQHRPQKR